MHASLRPHRPHVFSGLRNLFRRTHRAPLVAKRLGSRTRAVHGRRGKRRGPIVTPIYASSTWALESPRQGAEFARGSAPEACDTRLVYIETPANPTMMITDIREAVDAAESVRATTLADNTFASPINQRPIELGVDAVLHSATKYLGGHSDVVAGAVITASPRLFDRIWFTYKMLGPALGPFEGFLVRRGLKTLPIRMQAQGASAQALAESLENHRAVGAVHYPGLKSFPQHALARRQMSGFGAMLSFELKGGHRAGRRFVESVKVATLAVSLGGTETLVQHPASMTHGPLTESERATSGITEGLVRVSVGLEDTDDLIEDFDQAIRKAAR